jgi:tetratricopeptide (TPR) repeat protein
MDRGDLFGAIADFDRALSAEPEFIFAYFNRGISYEKIGRSEKGIADYKTVLALEPGFQPARERPMRLGVPSEEGDGTSARPPLSTGSRHQQNIDELG